MMNNIIQEVERIKRKQQAKNSKLVGAIDGLLTDIEDVLRSLELEEENNEENNGKDLEHTPLSNKNMKGTRSEQNKNNEKLVPSTGVNKWVRARCEGIVSKKYVASMKQNHKDYFTFISKLGKSIDNCANSDIQNVVFQVNNQKDIIKKLAVKYMKENTAFHISSGNIKAIQTGNKLEKLSKIQKLLDQSQFEEAVALIDNKSGSYPPLQCDNELKLIIIKSHCFNLFNQKKYREAIIFLKENHPHDTPSSLQEIGQMIHKFTYKQSNEAPRCLESLQESKLSYRSFKLIEKQSRRLLGLSENCLMRKIVIAGMLAMASYLRNKHVFDEMDLEKDVDITVNLPNDLIYHSIVHCPVSKEICNPSSNKALLQNCGHIIAELSVKKMLEMSRMARETGEIKCPTCPNVQKAETMKPVVY